ncbi:MAG: hypothetical protein LBH44_03520 [Treponema sp.]|jgi:hypothetical protein|nr:hypothetical protein [Treponema sp.]
MKHFAIITIILILGSCTTYKRSNLDFTVNVRSQNYAAGTIDAQFERILSISGLNKGDVVVSYYPVEDAVCLQFRNDFITFYQFWTRKSRADFIDALERYNVDYEQRTLARKNRRSAASYATVTGYLVWESFNFSSKGRSHPRIDVGYLFRKNSPYLTITHHEARNINEVTKTEIKNNIKQIIFLTRAQAAGLADILDQDYLLGLIPGSFVFPDPIPEWEDYSD